MPASNRPSPKETHNELTSLDVITALLAHRANVNAQLKAAQPFRTKVDRGADGVLTAGTTPFLRAAEGRRHACWCVCSSKTGADPKLATRNGINPLMAAAGLGTKEEDRTGRQKTEADAIETITLLLQAGVDVNAADSRTAAPPCTAPRRRATTRSSGFSRPTARKLDVKDRRGLTPLDAAMGRSATAGSTAAAPTSTRARPR